MSITKNNQWLDPDAYNRIAFQAFRRFLPNYRHVRGKIAAAVLGALVFSGTALFIPPIFAQVQAAMQDRSGALLLLALGAYLAITVVQKAAAYFITRVQAGIHTRLNEQISVGYYENVLNATVPAFLDFKRRSNVFQRLIDAMSVTAQVTGIIIKGIQAVIVIAVYGTVIGMISLEVLGVLVTGAVALFAYVATQAGRLRRKRQRSLSVNYPLVGRMMEIINGLLTIKALSAAVGVTRDITDHVARKREAEYDEAVTSAGVTFGQNLIQSLTLMVAVGVSFTLLLQDALALSDVFAVYVLIGGFLAPVAEMANYYQGLAVVSANLENYFEVLDLADERTPVLPAGGDAADGADAPAVPIVHTPPRGDGASDEPAAPSPAPSTRRPDRTDAPASGRSGSPSPASTAPKSPSPVPGPSVPAGARVDLDAVSFAYEEAAPVLSDLSVHIQPGEDVALIGKSGAGKTTLFRLLLGFIHPQAGVVSVNGRSLRTVHDLNTYRSRIGVVSQDDFLFKIPLRENLVFGMEEEVPEARLIDVLEQVNLWPDVELLEDGLDTVFDADHFSGGQKQRFLIARVLLRRPELVLLDEPTSALDFENEQEILRALERMKAGTTAITIAHRLTTVRGADRVLVLDEGRLLANGPHDELYATSEYYRSLCDFNSFIV